MRDKDRQFICLLQGSILFLLRRDRKEKTIRVFQLSVQHQILFDNLRGGIFQQYLFLPVQ